MSSEMETAEIVGGLMIESYHQGRLDAIGSIIDVMDDIKLPFVTKQALEQMQKNCFEKQDLQSMKNDFIKVFKEKRGIK